MTTKLMPAFLLLLAALFVAAGYCLARLADEAAASGAAAGGDFHFDDPTSRKH